MNSVIPVVHELYHLYTSDSNIQLTPGMFPTTPPFLLDAFVDASGTLCHKCLRRDPLLVLVVVVVVVVVVVAGGGVVVVVAGGVVVVAGGVVVVVVVVVVVAAVVVVVVVVMLLLLLLLIDVVVVVVVVSRSVFKNKNTNDNPTSRNIFQMF